MLQSISADHCQELGTSACPCVLANLEECLVCSQLQGKEICDCDWQKVCVYLDYHFDKKTLTMPDSKTEFFELAKIMEVSKDNYLVFLLVSEEILANSKPLSKVFLWPKLSPKNQRHPGVVLKVYQKEGILVLGVQLTDYKDKLTFLNCSEFALEPSNEPVILGLEYLKKQQEKNILLVASNFGQLLLIPLISDHLLNKDNKLIVFLQDPSKWVMEKLKRMDILFYTNNNIDLKTLIAKEMPEYCCSLGAEESHKNLAVMLDSLKLPIPLIINLSN